MAVWVCENCNSNNSEESLNCEICGFKRSEKSIREAKSREREEKIAHTMAYINNRFLGNLYKFTKWLFLIVSLISFIAIAVDLSLKNINGNLDDIWQSTKTIFPIASNNIKFFSNNFMAFVFCNLKFLICDKMLDNITTFWSEVQDNTLINIKTLRQITDSLVLSASNSINIFLQIQTEIYHHLYKHFN